jgi:hypothetical protein
MPFFSEALAPMRDAVEVALQALTLWQGHIAVTPPALSLIDSALVQTKLLPVETLSLVARIREDQSSVEEAQAGELLARSDRLLAQADALLSRP